MARPGRVGKGAHGLGRLVGVGGQEVVEAVVADGFEKPFAERGGINIWHGAVLRMRSLGEETNMYGPGSPLSALKHRQVSSTRTGPWIW